jgi:autotransporter-associated beta strand protein
MLISTIVDFRLSGDQQGRAEYQTDNGGDRNMRRSSYLAATALAVVALSIAAAASGPAEAANFTWGDAGNGATTATPNYNLGTNWGPATAPIAANQSAIFTNTGNTTVTVTAGPIAPDAWTFNANSSSYIITGSGVNFSLAGATGGIIDNASAGQTISIANNIGGAGVTVQQLANNTLVLSGTNTYTGGTTLNAGSISIGNISALGTGSIDFGGNAALESTVTGSLANAININAGSATIGATAGQTLTIGAIAPITYTAGAGTTLHFGSAADTGTIVLNARVDSLISVGGAISVDGGTLQFGAVNGGFFVNSALGGLTVGSGATAATLDVNGVSATASNLTGTNSGIILNNGAAATLTVNNTANTTFAGSIRNGTGATGLTKTGTGTLTLSGVNTYTGVTTVNAGTLSVNGSIANSAVTVNAGGTLGGNGTVGSTLINGGTLSPGNSIGLLRVQGSLVFTAASSYLVEVSPTASDRTNVTGTATLGGATVNASFATGTYVAKQYTILNATGGVSATFAAVANTNLPTGFHSSLSYDANDAFLNLDLNLSVPSGLNQNQQNVGDALTRFFNATGNIPLVFGTLTPAGLTQASGESATGTQQTTFDAMNLFMGVMTDPFVSGRGDAAGSVPGASQFAEVGDATNAYASSDRKRSGSERDAYGMMTKAVPRASFDQRWSVWAAGYGGSQTTDGNATLGSNTATSRIYGTAVGADYRFSPFTLAGFALAGGGTNLSVNGLGTGRSDLFQAGAFVRHTVGSAYVVAALAYGWQDVTTDRTLTIAGVDQLRGKFSANAYSGRLEGGYRYVTPWMGFTPYAAAQFTTFDLPAYAESVLSGANTFALSYASKSVTATRSELGLRNDRSFAMPDAILTLRGRVAWAHNFNTDRSIGATFQTLPGASFVVNGAAQAREAAITSASAEMKWTSGFSLAATFEGEFSGTTRSYAGKGLARYQW